MPALPSVIDPTPAPRITPDQLALIRNTIAKDATPDELRLYLFDCQRQGVHPLDKLIFFTKRKGKYTPLTSIDFMRIRAAATGECAGIDDAVFSGTPKTDDFCATVVVWRLVQGQRCAFSASARWSEYRPEANDFMWQKMPHVMLGKVAEALALRRGFPMQLSGLYAKEELDQAIDPRAGDVAQALLVEAPKERARLAVPAGAVRILSVLTTQWGGEITVVDAEGVEALHKTGTRQCAALAEQLAQEGVPVVLQLQTITRGKNLGKQKVVGLTRWSAPAAAPAGEPTAGEARPVDDPPL